MTVTGLPSEVDELDLGADPRPPRSPRSRRTRAVVVGMVAVVALVVVLVARSSGGDDPAPAARPQPTASSPAAGYAVGPVLTTVAGHDALQPPGLPGLGSTVEPVVLDPAPDVVAIMAQALPGLRDVHGGRIPDADHKYGVYLTGSWKGPGGVTSTVTLYSARAPGTTFGADRFVSQSRFDRQYTVHTEVSVFTGTGWWVHVVALVPDAGGAARGGEVDRLYPLAKDPRLVA